jgi:purine-binding chemotaxis protein CheW
MNHCVERRQVQALPTLQAASDADHGTACRVQTMPNEFLSLRLGVEEYGVDILRVQEIRSCNPPTRIADAPSFIKVVINLRGIIVPIVDLRLRLACEKVDYRDFTIVLMLNICGRVIGMWLTRYQTSWNWAKSA